MAWTGNASRTAEIPASNPPTWNFTNGVLSTGFLWVHPHPKNAATDTPEMQVEDMNLFDFFRFVKYHGGRSPYLTWYETDRNDMPIVIMSPVVKLREGADFTFGARWALMQYHPWTDRRNFLDMEETAVKEYFRAWVEEPSCPWSVHEQYLSDNQGRLRGVKKRRRRYHGTKRGRMRS